MPTKQNKAAEKNAHFWKSIGQLAQYCRSYLPAILLALAFAMAATVLTIIGPGKLSEITDLILEGLSGQIDLTAIVQIVMFVAALYLFGLLFNVLQGMVMTYVTQRTSKSLRSDIAHKFSRLPLSYFDGTTTGDILSRVTNDVDTIGQSLNQSLGSLVTSITTFCGTLFMMFYTNWIMALSGVIASAVGFAFMFLIVSHSQKYFTRQQEVLGKLNGHIEETYSGQIVVKAYNGERAAREAFQTYNSELYDCAWKSTFFSGLTMPLMTFIGNLGYVVVCIVGTVLTMRGVISFSVIVAFMIYIRLFSQPLSQFSQIFTSFQSAAAASSRVFAFLAEPEMENEEDKKASLFRAAGNVAFSDVRFGYVTGKPVIKKFSLEVSAGQKVAIVGPTGAGKTTLVNLLMRFYDPQGGKIRIDGIPTHLMRREDVHAQFGMVLQDTWLFHATIRENIVYNWPDVTNKQVEDACKAVGLHHFISTLPNGYDTILDDRTSLSSGQRQLVTIARAMGKNAPMLILDEATSSVDTRTEALIQQAMDKLMSGRTSFVIAHRLSTIKNADIILVMKDGDVIESGTHDALLQRGGFYAELYQSQFER